MNKNFQITSFSKKKKKGKKERKKERKINKLYQITLEII